MFGKHLFCVFLTCGACWQAYAAEPNASIVAGISGGNPMKTVSSALQSRIDALASDDERIRRKAVRGLQRSDLSHSPEQPGREAQAGTSKASSKSSAKDAWAPNLTEFRTAISALIGALQKDKSPDVRAAAATALRTYGPGAMEAVPALIGAFSDDHEPVRYWSACALASIGSAARPGLTAAQEDGRPRVKEEAARVLQWLGPNIAADAAGEQDTMKKAASRWLGFLEGAWGPGHGRIRVTETLNYQFRRVRTTRDRPFEAWCVWDGDSRCLLVEKTTDFDIATFGTVLYRLHLLTETRAEGAVLWRLRQYGSRNGELNSVLDEEEASGIVIFERIGNDKLVITSHFVDARGKFRKSEEVLTRSSDGQSALAPTTGSGKAN